MLCREVKRLVVDEKLKVWNDVAEKANSDFEVNIEFLVFVGRITRAKKKGIAALKNSGGVSVTSTKGKLEVVHNHYQKSGSCSVDSAFNDTVYRDIYAIVFFAIFTEIACN